MNTKSRQISFYNDFSCSMGKCPESCCCGWLVPIDEDTVSKYNSLKGLDFFNYRLSIRKRYDRMCFNANLRECKFHCKDGLCSLQKKYGEDYLSETCRIFPRTVYTLFSENQISKDYSDLPAASEFLELSCPVAAELFIKNINDMHIISVPFKGEIKDCATNEDINFWKLLIHANDTLNSVILNPENSLQKVYGILLKSAEALQNIYLNNDSRAAFKKAFQFLDNIDSLAADSFFVSASDIDKIMTGGYYHRRVKAESRQLYNLCLLYFNTFDKMNISDIDKIYSALPSGICVAPKLDFTMDRFLRCHLFYVLSESFAEVYEDYSFSSKITIAIIRNQLLSIFIWLYSNKKEPITSDNLHRILYSFHRRGAGNDGLYFDFAKSITTNCRQFR